MSERWGDSPSDWRDFDRWLTTEPERDGAADPVEVSAARLERAAARHGVDLSAEALSAAVATLRGASADPLDDRGGPRPCIYLRRGFRCACRDIDHDYNIPY